jgi:hypothetical protein
MKTLLLVTILFLSIIVVAKPALATSPCLGPMPPYSADLNKYYEKVVFDNTHCPSFSFITPASLSSVGVQYSMGTFSVYAKTIEEHYEAVKQLIKKIESCPGAIRFMELVKRPPYSPVTFIDRSGECADLTMSLDYYERNPNTSKDITAWESDVPGTVIPFVGAGILVVVVVIWKWPKRKQLR